MRKQRELIVINWRTNAGLRLAAQRIAAGFEVINCQEFKGANWMLMLERRVSGKG